MSQVPARTIINNALKILVIFCAWYTFLPVASLATQRLLSIGNPTELLLPSLIGPSGWCLGLLTTALTMWLQKPAHHLSLFLACLFSWLGVIALWKGFFIPYISGVIDRNYAETGIFMPAILLLIPLSLAFAVIGIRSIERKEEAT